MTHLPPARRYIVRELVYRTGSKSRQLERMRYFAAACRLAESASHDGRAVQVELAGRPLALYVAGKRVTEPQGGR